MDTFDNRPTVSVIIPVYNVEAYLSQCMDSVLHQTLENIEIILVDDFSTDSSSALCDEYGKSDARVKVIHKKQNQGLGFARNTGIEYATGKWVCFIDSDDILALNTLKTCVEIGEKSGAEMVRYRFEFFSGDIKPTTVDTGKELRYVLADTFPQSVAPILDSIACKPENTLISNASACSCLYLRATIEASKLRFQSERELISEDFIFNIEFAALCKAIAYTDYKFYFYRYNPNSLSKSFKANRIEMSARMCSHIETRLTQLGIDNARAVTVGNMLGNWRVHLRHIYATDMSFREKRRLHDEASNHEYVLSIAKDVHRLDLPLFQRLVFQARGSYLLTRLLFALRDYFKR